MNIFWHYTLHNRGPMSLEKAIKAGKEHRKPLRGGKAVDSSCNNHGSCPQCYGNRMYGTLKKLQSVKEEE